MQANTVANTVWSLLLYGLVATFGLGINILVLVAFVKGKLVQQSTIYILALQTLIVDVIFISIHLFYWIPKAIDPDFLKVDGYETAVLRLADFIGTYAWFHNALSHVFIASNRFVVLIFLDRSFFTRQRVITMAIVHHLLAFSITAATQFAIPCCRLSFNFFIFSYFNVPNGDMLNYSDYFLTVPVNTLSTMTSLICYTAIFFVVRRARSKVDPALAAKRRTEYSYALQFASLAGVFSFCWISFRVFPYIIPLSDPSLTWVFGLTTVFTMVNGFMNALVYLLNNKDVRRNLPSFNFYAYRETVFDMTTQTRSSNAQ